MVFIRFPGACAPASQVKIYVVRSQNLVLPEGTSTLIRTLINERTGMFFDNGKSDLLIDKLVATRHRTRFQFISRLLLPAEIRRLGTVEWQNVMNALSVQETYFWREFDQVRALVQTLVPQVAGSRIQIRHCESGAQLAPPARSR